MTNTEPESNDSVEHYSDAFDYQLDILKMELEKTDRAIGRIDEMLKSHKNWAILVWAGSLAVILGNAALWPYAIVSLTIPGMFWVADATWVHYQMRFDFRETKISEFLNSDDLFRSFDNRRLIGIQLLDPTGRQYKGTAQFEEKTSVSRLANASSVGILYFGMIIVSIIVAFVLGLMA